MTPHRRRVIANVLIWGVSAPLVVASIALVISFWPKPESHALVWLVVLVSILAALAANIGSSLRRGRHH